MKEKATFWAILLVILMNPAVSRSDSGYQSYFSALPDVPMMSGMEEVEDQTFVFDKAEGKVVETAGFLAESSPEELEKFYREALGQLGWKPFKTGVFVRDHEMLSLRVTKVGNGELVKFQLAPLSR